MLGEAPDFFLGKDQGAVPGDFKYAARPFNQGDFDARNFSFKFGLQTGGFGIVVSHHAVFNGNVHEFLRKSIIFGMYLLWDK